MAPTVYRIPPAPSQYMPSNGKFSIKGLKAKTANHPIKTYIKVEIILNRPVKKSFRIIPTKANPQTTPNKTQPMVPLSVTSAKGVYVPAIKT